MNRAPRRLTGPLVALVVASGCRGSTEHRAPDRTTAPGAPSPPSEPTAVAPTRDAAPATALHPLTWTIRAPAPAAAPSRLYATIDAGVDVAAQVPSTWWTDLGTRKVVVLAWNLAEVTLPMLHRDAGTLSADLTPDEKARLVVALGAPAVADLDTAKISFVTAVVSAHGLPTSNPMQAVIGARAQAAGIPTVYLETAAVQQGLLDRWLDLRALRALVANLDAVAADNRALVAAYVAGDPDALVARADARLPWKTAGRAGAELAALRAALIDERHAAWVTFLRPLLAEGNALVAVDALDALGPGGLVDQLQRAGFTVARD